MAKADDVFEKKESVLEHLGELIGRVKYALFFLAIGMGVAYVLAPRIVSLLAEPLNAVIPDLGVGGGLGSKGLVIIDPFEKVWVQLRVSGVVGLFLAFPLMAWQVAKFVGPGLYSSERRKIRAFLMSTYFIFLAGLVLGYLFSLPLILRALLEFGGMDQTAVLSLSRYINAAIGVLIATGLLMEIPIAVFFMSLWGWVSVAQWSKGRKAAIVLNAVISAILSPPDIMSMIILMVPIQVLYEGGILAARVAEWARRHDSPT